MKEITYLRNNSIFGKAKDLNTRRDNFQTLLKASFKDEKLLWMDEVEYEAYLEKGLINMTCGLCSFSVGGGVSPCTWEMLDVGWTEVTRSVGFAPKASERGRRCMIVGGAPKVARPLGRGLET